MSMTLHGSPCNDNISVFFFSCLVPIRNQYALAFSTSTTVLKNYLHKEVQINGSNISCLEDRILLILLSQSDHVKLRSIDRSPGRDLDGEIFWRRTKRYFFQKIMFRHCTFLKACLLDYTRNYSKHIKNEMCQNLLKQVFL